MRKCDFFLFADLSTRLRSLCEEAETRYDAFEKGIHDSVALRTISFSKRNFEETPDACPDERKFFKGPDVFATLRNHTTGTGNVRDLTEFRVSRE